jgi:hypothetical protein
VERRQGSDSTRAEARPGETYWVDLDVLTQEHLDDITAIYCQVYNRNPKKFKGSLELELLIRDVCEGAAVHTPKSFYRPVLDVRRKSFNNINTGTRYAVRFGVSSNNDEDLEELEVFTNAVDEYLRDSAGIAKPLSQMELESKFGLRLSSLDQNYESDHRLTFK